jgi:putative ABC transport system permease protein
LTIAFLLLGMLLSVREAFRSDVSVASSYRLRSQGLASIAEPLPVRYAARIAAVPGVRSVLYAAAEPAAYQDDPHHMILQAVSAGNLLSTFPELAVTPGEAAAFARDRQSLMAGPGAARRYGWKLGDTVTLRTNVLAADGTASWTFHLDAIYGSDDPKFPSDLTFVHYAYFNDGRVDGKDQVISFVTTIDDPRKAASQAQAIDRQFDTSTPRLKTQAENEAVEKQLAQFGDFATLTMATAAAVFVSMFLLAFNVWSERVQARRGEIATLFALVLCEALVLTALAAAAGLGLAFAASLLLKARVEGILAGFHFPLSALFTGGAIALAFGVLSSSFAALRAARVPLSALPRE